MGSHQDTRVDEGENFLEGKLLIAMPGMSDTRFDRSLIYMCVHSESGAINTVGDVVQSMRRRLESRLIR